THPPQRLRRRRREPRPPPPPPPPTPPLRFSSGPPFPCTTPSTETCVVVVSFMIAVPFSLGRPSWAASPLPRTPLPRSDTAPGISFENFLVRRLYAIRQRDGFGPTALHLLLWASSADDLWAQIDGDAPDPSSAHAAMRASGPFDHGRERARLGAPND